MASLFTPENKNKKLSIKRINQIEDVLLETFDSSNHVELHRLCEMARGNADSFMDPDEKIVE